jgi:hypothetical protein
VGHAVWPVVQLRLQTPAVHFCPAGQTLPQVPQLFGSLVVVAQ